MARALTFPAVAFSLTETLRIALVTLCAAALILAGEALPF